MTNQNFNPEQSPEAEDPLAFLREKAEQEDSSAPQISQSGWSPKVIGGHRKAWLIRGLIVLLGIITAVDFWFIQKEAAAPEVRVFAGGPPTQVLSVPANQSLLPTPTIQAVSGGDEIPPDPDQVETFPAPPTPTEPPLPEELQGVEIPSPPD